MEGKGMITRMEQAQLITFLWFGLRESLIYPDAVTPISPYHWIRSMMASLSMVLIVDALALDASPLQTARPNIIFIMTDDLGYGDLGCYGQKRIQTPHIDRMATEGMRFTQFYAGSTVCAPSRCVLMTGLHTGHALVRGNRELKPMGQWPLPDETITLAEVLKKSGYSTGLIGKWGLGGPDSTGHPNRQGFDSFFGYLCQRHAHNYYPEFLFRNGDRVPLEGNRVENERGDGAGYASERSTFSHDLCADEALDFIRQHQSNPFFLYLSLTIPHANNEGGRLGMEVPDHGPYAETEWPEPQKGHAAMITRMDADVGRLMALLKELEMDTRTLVFFTSDNGPHGEGGNDPHFNDSNGPLRGIKRDLYEGGIRIPMIARWPGVIRPNAISSHIGYFGDFMTTLAELAASTPPPGLDSISFLPTLLGKTDAQQEHDFLYWEFYDGRHFKAVRQGPWKGIQDRDGSFELYQLERDIGERDNLATAHPSKVKELRMHMERSHQDNALWQ
ncbi:MAG: arylsulfatase [Verrucomicrobiota bacterium]|nr:arylsulfatase [Verrucomicrobiota bacterium]